MDGKKRKYLEKQNANNRRIIDVLRDLILTNFPKIKETCMAEGLWYEGKFYIAAFRDHVNLGVGVVGLRKEEKQLFQGTGRTMRHLKFFSVEDIKRTKLLTLLNMVYTNTHCIHDIKWK